MHTASIGAPSQIGSQPMAPSPSNPGMPAGSQPINIQQGQSAQPQPQQSQSQQQQQGGGGGNGSSFNHQSQASNGNGGSGDHSNLVFPALHLHPLNNTFAPKQISLTPPGPQNRIKIGRQTNAKTVPHPSNGYFDSKVLSRMHAEVWSQDNKVFIKDVKSSNGTFINGERLSAEAQESDIFELHSEDMVEFGIDIVGDDNKTIIHHKVACRVYLVITAEDALGIRNDFASLYRGGGHGGPLGGNGVGPGAEGGLRRGTKGNTMSFDHILSRLQNELQKSRETGNELGGLTSTMNDIQETMGGGLPPVQHPTYQHMVPSAQGSENRDLNQIEASAAQSASVTALQSQLAETQASLASHVDKIRSLEGMLSEHEIIKAEVGMIKSRMEEARREMEEVVQASSGPALTASALNGRSVRKSNGMENGEDFDDGASMASMDTVTQESEDVRAEEGEKPPTGVDEVESAAIKGSSPFDSHEGPLAPPDMPAELIARDAASTSELVRSSNDEHFKAQNDALASRLEALEKQLEEALNLGRSLQSQHSFATDAVRALEDKVSALEKEVETNAVSSSSASEIAAGAGVGALGAAGAAAVVGNQSSVDEGKVMQAIEGRFTEWKQQLEEGWRKEREDWAEEREQLRKVVKAWDEANGKLEDEVTRGSTSGSTTSGESNTSEETFSSQASSTSSNSRNRSNSPSSRRSKASKRRAAKRHINPDLRALLYKDSHNSNFEAHEESSEEDEETDTASVPADARSSSSSAETSTEGTSRSAASSGTSPSPSVTMGLGSKLKDGSHSSDLTVGRSQGHNQNAPSRKDKNLNDAWNALSKEGRLPDHPATLPLGAAGIVVMGMAAWILAGRGASSTISDFSK